MNEERTHRGVDAGPPVVFSGIQPTGKMHIGNYIGAISVWAELQATYRNIFCIVDLHALTIPEAISPDYLRAKVREYAALYIACGIDPARSAIFVQSHIAAHSELAWLLNCVSPVGWLERMTQYKIKSATLESVGMGLLDYPVLQAADILLYQTKLVPVGEDQKQHIELTRDIAQRFAHLYKPLFTLPEPFIRKSGARIMGLDDPQIKMSKSLGERKAGHAIGLVDSPDKIRKTVKEAVTDAGRNITFEGSSPGVLNLLTIYEVLSGENRDQIEARFEGRGYGHLKSDLIDLLLAVLAPIRTKYEDLMIDPRYIDMILDKGAEEVEPIAKATLKAVHEVMGAGRLIP